MAQKIPVVRVRDFIEACPEDVSLSVLAENEGLDRRIREPTVNRPGLALAGFTRYFASKRVQVIGSAEHTFLRSLTPEERRARYKALFRFHIPLFVFGRNLKPDPIFLEEAEEAKVPVCRAPMITMQFINHATLLLDELFAPRGTVMGSMIDILGVGVIVKGKSGIGKSEAVLALIERGYSLVSDDVTLVKRAEPEHIIGYPSPVTRDYMEVRGIGIINVAVMFGVKSVRHNKRVDLVVYLKSWDEMEDIERVGIDETYDEILGVKIPSMTIPVRPGRDIARLVEVAAFQSKLKLSGVNPAEEFNNQLIERMSDPEHSPPRP